MKRIYAILILSLVGTVCLAQAPADRREVRSGNRDFRKNNFKEAEIDYRRALVKDSTSVAGNYNLANTLYRMEDYENAAKYAETAASAVASDAAAKNAADIFFNQGDVALKQQNYNAAVEAFKQSLLRNPGDIAAKENYIYAKKMLDDQQQNQQQNQDQNQDQNNQNNQDQQQQQQDQNQDKQDQNQDQQQQQNQDNQDQQQQQQEQQQNQDQQLSPQAAQQMLQAVEAKEKETQEKVKKEKALMNKSRQKDKNW